MKLSLILNDEPLVIECDGRKLLAEVLRDDLQETSVRIGCHTGDCGCCTVRYGGAVRKSCLILAASAEGAAVGTVAASDARLDALKESFLRCGAFQCGFCTPGMLLVAAELLSNVINPTETEIRNVLTGNLCRCTGYDPIITAIGEAASQLVSTESSSSSSQP